MRILADENVPRTIVAWLRGEGVPYAAELRTQRHAADLLTEIEGRVYVIFAIEEKDRGEIVCRDRRNSQNLLLRPGNRPVVQRSGPSSSRIRRAAFLAGTPSGHLIEPFPPKHLFVKMRLDTIRKSH